MMFFSEKISIFTVEISDDLFLVVDLVFRIFPFFSQIFRVFTMLNVVYDPFPHKKTHYFTKKFLYDTFFYSVRIFARIRQHYFSKYWEDGCMGRPPPQIFGGTVPPRSPPLTLTKPFYLNPNEIFE